MHTVRDADARIRVDVHRRIEHGHRIELDGFAARERQGDEHRPERARVEDVDHNTSVYPACATRLPMFMLPVVM